MPALQRITIYLLFGASLLALVYHIRSVSTPRLLQNADKNIGQDSLQSPVEGKGTHFWANRHVHYPVSSYAAIPKPQGSLPAIQHVFTQEETRDMIVREQRRSEIKVEFQRCWASYRKHAWMRDELAPISGGARDTFGGWAATLVDSLDLLWITNMNEEFREAVDAALKIDFSKSAASEINVFETTIRYLGGFLAAYDLSGDKRLLEKTLELAEMLYAAFDTPNRMPITRWDFERAMEGQLQEADDVVLVAEIGSLTIEFTHLAQITGDPKWYDAVARIMAVFDSEKDKTDLPGMWPLVVNGRTQDFHTGQVFTLGAMADSMYEYLPKMHALLGGSDFYANLYNKAIDTAIQHAIYRPMLPDAADVLMSGQVQVVSGTISAIPAGQHLVCFAGGMLALGGRLTKNETHVDIGRKLTDGCIWAYEHSELGIMPETFSAVRCENRNTCPWNEAIWHQDILAQYPEAARYDDVQTIIANNRLRPGFSAIKDRRYILRPEAIESVFILYRITGDPALIEHAWRMFEAIRRYTTTELANAAISDVTDPQAPKTDSMESFWTAETLKYFYLMFSPPDVISLDEYVFNTEAHPMKRPV